MAMPAIAFMIESVEVRTYSCVKSENQIKAHMTFNGDYKLTTIPYSQTLFEKCEKDVNVVITYTYFLGKKLSEERTKKVYSSYGMAMLTQSQKLEQ